MPYANNHGIRIHYQVKGKGPSILLHHGFGFFSDFWNDTGAVDALKDNYQLILMDSRGCGASDKPHDRAAYSLTARVADVVAVLDDLGLSQAHFWGYSMGGYIGWGIARYASERFLSLIIGGSGPLEKTRDETESGPGPVQQLLSQGLESFVTFCAEASGRSWQPKWKASLLANDIVALSATAARWEGIGGDDALAAMTLPFLLYAGENDDACPGALRASKVIPNAVFVSFPGLNHMEAALRTDLVLPHVTEFLTKVSQV